MRSAETRRKLADAGLGNRNHWKGGRHVTPSGYVRVHVGREHPMGDRNGYVYEHRLVVADDIGRPLTSHEQVHHVNGDKADNRRENLLLFGDAAAHTRHHHEQEVA